MLIQHKKERQKGRGIIYEFTLRLNCHWNDQYIGTNATYCRSALFTSGSDFYCEPAQECCNLIRNPSSDENERNKISHRQRNFDAGVWKVGFLRLKVKIQFALQRNCICITFHDDFTFQSCKWSENVIIIIEMCVPHLGQKLDFFFGRNPKSACCIQRKNNNQHRRCLIEK